MLVIPQVSPPTTPQVGFSMAHRCERRWGSDVALLVVHDEHDVLLPPSEILLGRRAVLARR